MIITKSGASWRRIAAVFVGVALLLAVGVLQVSADGVKHKDGTDLEAEVKKEGSSYQIKTKDGQYKFTRADDVKSITADGEAGAAPPASSAGRPKPPAAGTGWPAPGSANAAKSG